MTTDHPIGPAGLGPSRRTAMQSPIHPAAVIPAVGRAVPEPRTRLRRWPTRLQRGFVVAIVPIDSSVDNVLDVLDALDEQTRRPDAVVVVADHASVGVTMSAMHHGATVVETADNHHGRPGAINLAVNELLDLLDPDDAIVLVAPETLPGRHSVARALQRLWPPPRQAPRRLRRRTGADVVVAAPAPRVGSSRSPITWPGRPLSGLVAARAEALADVIAARRCGDLPDRSHLGHLLDVTSRHSGAELRVALANLDKRVVVDPRCTFAERSPTLDLAPTPTMRAHYRQVGLWQAGSLDAVVDHRRGSHTLLPATRCGLALLWVATVPALLAASSSSLAAGEGLPLTVAVASGAVAAAWIASTLAAGGRARSSRLGTRTAWVVGAAGGVLRGTWESISAIPLRRRSWRHPHSGRRLARHPGPRTALAGGQRLVVVATDPPAIAISRSAPAPDAVRRRRLRAASAFTAGIAAALVVIGVPLVAPWVGWAMAAVSAITLTGSLVVQTRRSLISRQAGV